MTRGSRPGRFFRMVSLLAFCTTLAAVCTLADTAKPSFRWEKPILWEEPDGPEAREHGTVIVDEASDRAILIGGLGYKPEQFTPLEDVWQLSLKTDRWVRLHPATKVPAGGSRRAARVPGRSVSYLFGGLLNNQLVQVDFSNELPLFSEIPQDSPPAPRGLHAFAYDPALDLFVLFGGIGGNLDAGQVVLFNDLWTMKLQAGRAVWTQLRVPGGPSPRSGFACAYDTEGGRLIIFGGTQGVPPRGSDEAGDTWVLHLREEPPAWREWKDGAPPARRNACYVWDQGEQRLFLCGGAAGVNTSAGTDLFVLDAKPAAKAWDRWQLGGGPTDRASGFGFHDPARRRILIGFGNWKDPATQQYRDLFPLSFKQLAR